MIRDHSGRLPLAPALLLLGTLLAVAALASIGSGAYDLALMDILKVVAGREASDPVAAMVVLEVRLPRFLLGFLVGAVLGVSGAILQGLFRNPWQILA